MAVASEQLWNNIRFQATVAKETMERRPFLGSRFLISKNRRPLLGTVAVNTFPRQRIRMLQSNGVFYMVRAEKLWERDKVVLIQLSVESQTVKRSLGGWCEMSASLGVSCNRQLEGSRHSERTWARKQRNSRCSSRYQATTSEDTVGWKRLSIWSSELQNAEINDGTIIKYNYELCVKVVNKSNLQSKNLGDSATHNCVIIYCQKSRIALNGK
jgi:hypothetical protein